MMPLLKAAFLLLAAVSISVFLLQYRNILWSSVAEQPLDSWFKSYSNCNASSALVVYKTFFSEKSMLDMKRVLEAQKHLAVAHRYSKGGKVSLELKLAIQVLQSVLNDAFSDSATSAEPFELDFDSSNNTSVDVHQARDVCPEIWRDVKKFGYPYYFDTFTIINCTGVPVFASLITILINTIHSTDPSDLERILNGVVVSSYSNVPVLVACRNTSCVNTSKTNKYPVSISFVEFPDDATEGKVWKILVAAATTEYVFIARNIQHFLPDDARLERLVRLLNFTGADVVGGGYRNEDGRWSHSCFQTAMRNYAFRLVEGYDLSYNSCLYCDYVGGPFAARTHFIQKFIDEELFAESLFMDIFAQMRYNTSASPVTIMTCPDAMYYTRSLNISKTMKSDWLNFVQKWSLNLVILPSAERHFFTCPESKTGCPWKQGIGIPLCCLKELSDMMKTLMTFCEQFEMGCEYEGGSVVGAMKFGSNLPWERDGDINWMAKGYDTMLNLTDAFKAHGYNLLFEESPKQPPIRKCMQNTSEVNCGYFALRHSSGNWRVEIWGVTYMAQHYLLERNISVPTKGYYDGLWVNSHPNPALYSRNLYGDDAFAHVEHWMTLGYSSGWVPYKTGRFLPCPKPGFHGCLDNFLPYGNLQFLDVWI